MTDAIVRAAIYCDCDSRGEVATYSMHKPHRRLHTQLPAACIRGGGESEPAAQAEDHRRQKATSEIIRAVKIACERAPGVRFKLSGEPKEPGAWRTLAVVATEPFRKRSGSRA